MLYFVRLRHTLILLMAFSFAVFFTGCKRLHTADTSVLYQSGMWSDTIQQLRGLDVSDSEVADLMKAHQAGLSDDGCVRVVRLARSRQQMFTDGDHIADLLGAGMSETNVLELATLNQLGPRTIESQGVRLAGYSDRVVMAVARRRSQGLPTVSSTSLAELKNTGRTEQQILDLISRGLTDEQVGQIVAAHNQLEKPQGFVRRSSARH
ncbi:MAG TPA: hypothetical protein VFO34_17195 [Candidatus Acidoferrales bacterium]|nr:hypothetical protein [Candidatus Acidoferrales bacterium]